MRMCTEDEAAAHPVFENQICAVGAGTSTFSVSVHFRPELENGFITDLISQGDSGGPISLKSGDQHVQVGDVSFGPSCIVPSFTVSDIIRGTFTLSTIQY